MVSPWGCIHIQHPYFRDSQYTFHTSLGLTQKFLQLIRRGSFFHLSDDIYPNSCWYWWACRFLNQNWIWILPLSPTLGKLHLFIECKDNCCLRGVVRTEWDKKYNIVMIQLDERYHYCLCLILVGIKLVYKCSCLSLYSVTRLLHKIFLTTWTTLSYLIRVC